MKHPILTISFVRARWKNNGLLYEFTSARVSDIPEKCCHSHHEFVIEENKSLSNFEPNVLKEAVHGARSNSLNNYHIQCRVCGWCRIEDYRKLSLTIELRVSRYKLRQNVRATMNWGG